jgi:hypothetical protein
MAKELEGFLTAYRAMLDVADQIAPPSLTTAAGRSRIDYFRPNGVQYLLDTTSAAAGRAERASQELGIGVLIFNQQVNPIADWRNSLRPMHPVTPDLVQSHCLQLIGSANHLRETARLREAGLTGLLARFLRFPYEVREAAGVNLRSERAQRGAFVIAVAAQVVAALAVAAILAGLGFIIA